MVIEDITRRKAENMINSVRRIFRHKNIDCLTKEAYIFITLYMGFIAHYDVYGFCGAYRDLRDFALRLQTSEYSNDRNYNLNRDNGEERENILFTMKSLVGIAREFEDETERYFGEKEKIAEISLAEKLAGRHGYELIKRSG